MVETMNLTDQLLIAMPGLGDPNFYRTVTYICQHNEQGAVGIVINRPTDLHLKDILQQMEITVQGKQAAHSPVYYGGPVQPECGFVVHERKKDWDSTLAVSSSIALTTSRDILEAIAEDKGPSKRLIALGYAGWGEGQQSSPMTRSELNRVLPLTTEGSDPPPFAQRLIANDL